MMMKWDEESERDVLATRGKGVPLPLGFGGVYHQFIIYKKQHAQYLII